MMFGKLLLSGAVATVLSLLPAFTAQKADAMKCVDVALVLTVDSSASVSKAEFSLQKSGISAAFRDPAVHDAISMAGEVAVSVMFWGSEGLPKPQSEWILMENPADAERFAYTVESMSREVSGDTGLGAGMMAALQKFDSLERCVIRQVVNVSGDGEETRVFRRKRLSLAPPQVRAIAEARSVEINALAILNEEENLAEYYASNVITGPDAFVMQVASYGDFSHALRKKLIREIGPRVVSGGSGAGSRGFPLN